MRCMVGSILWSLGKRVGSLGGYFGVIFVSLGSLWPSKLPLRSPRDGISNKIRNWWKKLDCGASVLGFLCRQNAIF